LVPCNRNCLEKQRSTPRICCPQGLPARLSRDQVPENQPRWLVAIMPVLLVLAYLIEIALLWNLV
jgi:hypothetical protein